MGNAVFSRKQSLHELGDPGSGCPSFGVAFVSCLSCQPKLCVFAGPFFGFGFQDHLRCGGRFVQPSPRRCRSVFEYACRRKVSTAVTELGRNIFDKIVQRNAHKSSSALADSRPSRPVSVSNFTFWPSSRRLIPARSTSEM